MNTKDESNIIEIEGHKITASYLWTLNTQERIDCLYKVFKYYKNNGFPYEVLRHREIINQFNKLKKFDSNNVINKEGFVSNSGSLCLDVCRHFCKDYFWNASSEKMMSIYDVFNNEGKFIKVLKNRMGWNISKEDDIARPYMFSISDNMIRTGIRNSGLGYGVSNFRPTIAKYFYEKYLKDIEHPTILDYSAGWGARALAAASLNIDYIGIDPLTYNCVNDIFTFLRQYNLIDSSYKGYCINSGSEDTNKLDNYIQENSVDLAFSCPPYFNLEVYSNDDTQSYNEFDEFSMWIEFYWKPTVKNCIKYLKNDGKFVLIIKDFYKNLPLKEEMNRICEEEGLVLLEQFQYKTSTNHLSGKKKSGRTTKNTEHILSYYIKK